jgi:hypothetical protein
MDRNKIFYKNTNEGKDSFHSFSDVTSPCHSEHSEESEDTHFMFTDPSLRSG